MHLEHHLTAEADAVVGERNPWHHSNINMLAPFAIRDREPPGRKPRYRPDMPCSRATHTSRIKMVFGPAELAWI